MLLIKKPVKNYRKKFGKLCLHSTYTIQNSSRFDEIFHQKFRESFFTFMLFSAVINPIILTRDFLAEKKIFKCFP